jgi:hypothetical protein
MEASTEMKPKKVAFVKALASGDKPTRAATMPAGRGVGAKPAQQTPGAGDHPRHACELAQCGSPHRSGGLQWV